MVLKNLKKKNFDYIKILDSFPKVCITYKILPTIITKRKFSKLTLIKYYLRLIMSQ